MSEGKSLLFSALAIADLRVLLTRRADLRGIKLRTSTASAALRPCIALVISRTLHTHVLSISLNLHNINYLEKF